MSVAMSIFLVLGLFLLVGLAGWAAVAIPMSSRAARSRPVTRAASFDDSRETVGQYAG